MKKILRMMYRLCAFVKKRHFELKELNGCCANIGAEGTIDGGNKRKT